MKIRFEKKHLRPLVISTVILSLFTVGFVLKDQYEGAPASRTPALVTFLNKFEIFWYDFKFRARPPQKASGDVIVAKIDDASLERWGRWPWNRSVYVQVLDYLYELGAEVVGFDAVFSEPEFQERYVRETFEAAGEGQGPSLKDQLKLSEENITLLKQKLPAIGDQMFASAVKRFPKTVMGYAWQDRRDCYLYNPEDADHQTRFGKALSVEDAKKQGLLHVEELSTRVGYLSNQGISIDNTPMLDAKNAVDTTNVYVMGCPLVNRPQLSANAKRQGFFNAVPDSDGIFRKMVPVLAFDAAFIPKSVRDFLPEDWFKKSTFFPSLALEAVAAYFNSDKISVETYLDGDKKLSIRSVTIDRKGAEALKIPTLPDGSIPSHFYGAQKTENGAFPPIPEFSLGSIDADLKDMKFQQHYGFNPTKPLEGKIVLIGPTALGVYDLRPSPVQGDYPGVFHHATLASRLLEYAKNPQSQLMVRFASLPISLIFLWSMGAMIALFLIFSPAVTGASGTIVFLALILGVDFFIFHKYAYETHLIITAIAFAILFITIFAYKYFTEEKERAFVKGAFEKYVSPDVVGDILKDPKKLNLGGQKKELTVMFSDIRGFTTISEKMDAASLAKFLNDYLSPMTDIILENKGTIDKYMGDAIMAIFGAPVEFADHPAKAVDASLAMLKKLAEMRIAWKAVGLPEIDVGIGLNTGDMSVGNMGSTRIFSYTVMGDSVNLGSRLEGINKEYGTHLIVSEYTRKFLGPEYVLRELDRVKVKGKKHPVTIFECMGKGEWPELRTLAKQFEAALSLYYTQHFAEAKVMFMALPSDKTSAIYVERCDMWLAESPGTDWDGSWTMKTK